jgi:hypothetical protein
VKVFVWGGIFHNLCGAVRVSSVPCDWSVNGGKFLRKLNTSPSPIAKKYREGKLKRTLKRGLKVPETVKVKANVGLACGSFMVREQSLGGCISSAW